MNLKFGSNHVISCLLTNVQIVVLVVGVLRLLAAVALGSVLLENACPLVSISSLMRVFGVIV